MDFPLINIFLFFSDVEVRDKRIEYFRNSCMFLWKMNNLSVLHSEVYQECVLSNEMAARRRHIKSRCDLIHKQHLNPKLKALNFEPFAGSGGIMAAPVIDTARLYVFKYRLDPKFKFPLHVSIHPFT